VAGVVGGEIRVMNFSQRIQGAERVEAIADTGEVGSAELRETAVQRIGEGFLQRGELGDLLAGDGLGGEGRVKYHIGENLENGEGVGGKAGGLDEQGVVAGRGGDRGAERLERIGNLVGTLGGGTFRQGGGKELVQAVGFQRFRRHARARGGLEMDERHAAIREKRELKSVRKRVGGDAVGDCGGFFPGGGGDVILRIYRGEGKSVFGKPRGDAADVVGGYGVDGGEMAAGEIEIARLVPVRGEVGGAA